MVRKGALNSVGGQEEVCGAAVGARAGLRSCGLFCSSKWRVWLWANRICVLWGAIGDPWALFGQGRRLLENQSAGAPSAECAGGDICF